MPEAILCLASASPRRRELLLQLGIEHCQVSTDIEEIRLPNETPATMVQRLALAKARAGIALCPEGLPVLGADTDVVLDDEVLGKPGNIEEAAAMLGRLSGRSHEVLSAVALIHQGQEEVLLSQSRVWFAPLTDTIIQDYCQSGEPLDKAGAYGIQGPAAAFIERIEGSYSGIMGLPLFETAALLRAAGLL